MSIKQTIKVTQGNARPDFFDVIRYPKNSDITLTGATVTWNLEKSDGTAVVTDRACAIVITDTVGVKKEIAWSENTESTDFADLGDLCPFLKVTYADSDVETIRLFDEWQIEVCAEGCA